MLDLLATFKENWDGYKSHGIYPEAISNTKDLLRRLPAELVSQLVSNDISPCNNGTVMLEWEKPNLDYQDYYFNVEMGITKINYYCRLGGNLYGIDEPVLYEPKTIPTKIAELLVFFLNNKS